jgi:hypothetical protein
MKWSLLGLGTDKFRSIPVYLAPGESTVVESTMRSLSYNAGTTFVISIVSGRMRIAADFGQRTSRPSGDATTQWVLTQNGTLTRAQAVGGVMPTFASVVLGDQLTIAAGFLSVNQGDFTVVGKGADYVEFVNENGAAENVTNQIRIYGNGPVQAGDLVDVSDINFSYLNQGVFSITRVTDQFVEVVNPNAIPQSVTGVSSGFAVYPFSYKWMLLAVDHKTIVGLNGDNNNYTEVEPDKEGDIVKHPGLFLKRGKVFQIRIKNPGLTQVRGFLVLAE